MLVKCPSCKGGGKIMGLGMVYRKCVACTGTGQVNGETIIRATGGGNITIKTIPDEPLILDKPLHPGADVLISFEEPSKLEVKPILKTVAKVEEKPKNVKGSNSKGKK